MTNFAVSKVVDNLPQALQPSTLYFVRTGAGFDLYLTDKHSPPVALHLNETPIDVVTAIDLWWNNSPASAKLGGISAGATKNATDASLRDRSTHTGQQAISTVTGLQAALDSKPNTDTKYTAGNGLSLTGTAFTLPVSVTGSGTFVKSVVQTSGGISITLGTPPDTNTTYNTGTLQELIAGTSTDGKVQSAKLLGDWQEARDALLAQPTVVTADTTVGGERLHSFYAVNTTDGVRTLTLPGNPVPGMTVTVLDYADTCNVHRINIARNNKNIHGKAENIALTLKGQQVRLMFLDQIQGWKVVSSTHYGGF